MIFRFFSGAIVLLSTIFIDLDHVLIYFLETKNINPFKFWAWSMRRKKYYNSLSWPDREKLKSPHFILHGVEFVFILILLALIHNFFFWVLLGIVFHIILDFIDLFYKGMGHYSIKTSQIWLWQRNKKKKKLNYK